MKWIAHRGVSSRYPENTMAAFEAARDLGCDGIETDVQLSSDGIAVLTHDRLAGPARDWVRLQDLLASFPALELLIEAKVFDPAEHVPLLDVLLPALAGHLGHVCLLCFDLGFLAAAHARCPGLRCVLNRKAGGAVEGDTDFLHAYSVDIDGLTPAFPREGKRLMAWTCNTKAQVDKAKALGVDVLMSDNPPNSCIEMGGGTMLRHRSDKEKL